MQKYSQNSDQDTTRLETWPKYDFLDVQRLFDGSKLELEMEKMINKGKLDDRELDRIEHLQNENWGSFSCLHSSCTKEIKRRLLPSKYLTHVYMLKLKYV